MTTLLRRLPAAGPPARALPCARCIATLSRTYDDALALLSTLQPNASAKALFDASSHPRPHPQPPHAHPAPSPSLNARAIPEMQAWLSQAGIPPTPPLRVIHIAGTKGKGTTASHATSILRAAGRRVGTYTSPHLVTVRERIRLDGAPLSRALFARYFFEMWDAVGVPPSLDPGGGGEPGEDALVRPFYFRFLTILAFHVFLRERINDAVVECGIGGEYDATNVLPACCVSACVVTHLERDHVAMLGDTIEEIAWHKAGIFKRGVPAFTRPQGDAAMTVLRARAKERGTGLVEVLDTEAGRWASGPAPFDRDNRALAAAAAATHLGQPTEGWMSEAMNGARLPGRCQVLKRGGNRFFLDGAHTRDSITHIGGWFAAESNPSARRVLLFNQQERDAGALLEFLVESFKPGVFDEAVFCRNEVGGDVRVQRALGERMGEISAGTRVVVVGDLGEALRGVEGEVLVTGSLYLVGGVLKALGEGA